MIRKKIFALFDWDSAQCESPEKEFGENQQIEPKPSAFCAGLSNWESILSTLRTPMVRT